MKSSQMSESHLANLKDSAERRRARECVGRYLQAQDPELFKMLLAEFKAAKSKAIEDSLARLN